MQKTTPTTRARIHALVRADPGIHIRRIAALTGQSWNTVQYHLRRMEAADLIASQKVEGNVCYFDKTAGAYKGKTGQALLRDPRNALVAQHLVQNVGLSQREIAEGLGLAASVVHRRVQKLEQAGLIERVSEGRSVLVFPKEDLTVGLDRAGLLPRTQDAEVEMVSVASIPAPAPAAEVEGRAETVDVA